jgi:hypothetical protein
LRIALGFERRDAKAAGLSAAKKARLNAYGTSMRQMGIITGKLEEKKVKG